RPVAHQVDEDGAFACARHQQDRGQQRGERERPRHRALHHGAHAPVLDEQRQRAAEQRQQDRQDRELAHQRSPRSSRTSPASTWSLSLSARLRIARTIITAVIANEITIAVSTSACGSGSVWLASVASMPGWSTGGLPTTRRPLEKISRLVAYDSSVSPRITSKLRARRIRYTPANTSTPMPLAIAISIRRPPP